MACSFIHSRRRKEPSFFSPAHGQRSLRVDGISRIASYTDEGIIPPHYLEQLTSALAPYDEGNEKDHPKSIPKGLPKKKYADWVNANGIPLDWLVADGPTRISNLVKRAFAEGITASQTALKRNSKYFCLTSPVHIVSEFLTDPEALATCAYSLFSTRNYLFSQYQIVPELGGENYGHSTFTVGEVETGMSQIWTSLRPRYESKGFDPLPPGVAKKPNGLIRAYLAAKGLFFLRFKTKSGCEAFLQFGVLTATNTNWFAPIPSGYKKYENENIYEYVRSPYLEKLPETAEIVNELFGLPIPLRGADTIFRGGLKFTAQRGLVMALHGGPGSGKTSMVLGLCAALSPLGISSLFLTSEETEDDLKGRMETLLPDEIKRLSFYPNKTGPDIQFERFRISPHDGEKLLTDLVGDVALLADKLEDECKQRNNQNSNQFQIPKTCQHVVVLDGLHDFFSTIEKQSTEQDQRGHKIGLLYNLIERFKKLKALVIITTGLEWVGDASLDYLVDVAMRLTHDSVDEYGAKPDRRIRLSKARHQLCASGIHGVQIAGTKGVRFSPQINYRLDQRAMWRTRLPDQSTFKPTLRNVISHNSLKDILEKSEPKAWKQSKFSECGMSANIFCGSHIFLNGTGSGGKAALALKIAMAPYFIKRSDSMAHDRQPALIQEKILIVSFLYPSKYYEHLKYELNNRHKVEYPEVKVPSSRINVFHLYPGHLKPNDLFNRIEWELDAAELQGAPYTFVIIDGIHNVFLQFPALEAYSLFWPQLYSSLRTRPITTITTHTTLSVPADGLDLPHIDDKRSEPLRHALVQKTDFQFEIDPWHPINDDQKLRALTNPNAFEGLFTVKTLTAIGQPLPKGEVLWNREEMVLFEAEPKRYEPKQSSFELQK